MSLFSTSHRTGTANTHRTAGMLSIILAASTIALTGGITAYAAGIGDNANTSAAASSDANPSAALNITPPPRA